MKKILIISTSPRKDGNGTTKAQAQRLADLIGADIHEITAYEPYTETDLDWRDEQSRSSVERIQPTAQSCWR